MISYPAELPAPLLGYGFEPENSILRTQMASGRARQRTLYTSTPTFTSIEWLFGGKCRTSADAQARLFEAWARGLARHQWVLLPIRSPMGRESREVRFMASPNGPYPVGPRAWRYTAQVELREIPMLLGDWAELPDFVLRSDLFDLAINREWPEA